MRSRQDRHCHTNGYFAGCSRQPNVKSTSNLGQ